jgi:gas vesicle protein
MRDKVDWQKETQELIKSTPEEEYSSDIQDPVTGTTIKKGYKRKTINSIMNSFNTLLSAEALQDMQYELGIKDSKSLNKTLQSIASTGVYNKVNEGISYNFDRLDQTSSSNNNNWVEGVIPMYDKKVVETANELIGKNGEIIPTSATWSEGYNSQQSEYLKGKLPFTDRGVSFPVFGMNIGGAISSAISGVFEPKSEEYTINRMRESGIPIDQMQATSKKLNIPLQEILKSYKQMATTQKAVKFEPSFNNKVRKEIEERLQGNMASVQMIDPETNEPISNEEKKQFSMGDIKVAGKLQPNNRYSPHTWQATVAYKDDEGTTQVKNVFIPHNIDPSSEQDLKDLYEHEKYKSLASGNYIRQSDYIYELNKKTNQMERVSSDKGFTVTINPLTGEETKEENK